LLRKLMRYPCLGEIAVKKLIGLVVTAVLTAALSACVMVPV